MAKKKSKNLEEIYYPTVRMRNLVKKISEAKAKGNEQEIKKAYLNLTKHQKQEEVYRKKAEESGYCWV